MRISNEMIQIIVDREMTTVRGMKKSHLFQLVRELMEERVLEMDDHSIYEVYRDIETGRI